MSASDSEENKCFELSDEDIAAIEGSRLKIPRRKRVADVPLKYQGRTVVRIATWNLCSFSTWKARNLGVKEVICMSILENGIGILAAEELADKKALSIIRDELNSPTTPNVKNWQGRRGKWECMTSEVAGMMYRSTECNGFLWDTSRGISLTDHGLLQRKVAKKKGEKKDFARRPFIGYFKVRRFDFVLLSVHLKATGLKGEDLAKLKLELDKVPDILEALDESMPDEKDIIIVGDFNLTPSDPVFDEFRDKGYVNVIDDKTPTNISKRHMKGTQTYDNIWILQGNPDKQEYTGRSGVCRSGLDHPMIPHNGWEPNGLVSDHAMVWAEFFYGKDYDDSSGKEQLSLKECKRYKVEDTSEM